MIAKATNSSWSRPAIPRWSEALSRPLQAEFGIPGRDRGQAIHALPSDLDDFVTCYNPESRHERRATWSEETPDGRWRSYSYNELLQRDKVSLDLFWLRDGSFEDAASLSDPDLILREIVEDLRAGLEQFDRFRAIWPSQR